MLISCTLVQMYSVLETYTEEPVPASWQSDCFVCIHSLSPVLNAVGEGRRNCDKMGMFPFVMSMPPPFPTAYLILSSPWTDTTCFCRFSL